MSCKPHGPSGQTLWEACLFQQIGQKQIFCHFWPKAWRLNPLGQTVRNTFPEYYPLMWMANHQQKFRDHLR